MKPIQLNLKRILLLIFLIVSTTLTYATGEPSTHFNIFVPPNNDAVRRDVCVIITAIEDSTQFSIVDDNMDGDSDDSKSGVLMAGQSYILYIRDNGVNDDAKYASGGTLKQDGDYFIINANKLIYASQSTNSDWQHDWVPAVNKSGIGQKFIIYSPQPSSSKRDINVFAYQDNTDITIRKISTAPTVVTGYTNVNMFTYNVVVQKKLNIGQDIIYYSGEGRDLLESGATYVIESNQPITVQYGALYANERDGGGYVPSFNGNSAGDLFYFGVPFQSGTSGEQEIRIVSADANNAVTLERYSGGSWIAMKNWTVQSNAAVDWVGRNNGNVNYPTVFRIKCSPGKKVAVFEANWMETGSVGTSDLATMCSSINGTSSGKDFLTYMSPPGLEQNVRNPFTGNLFGQQLTHVYLFASKDTCHVSVKDAFTSGSKISRNYTILPDRYVDCFLTLAEWKSIYNGTGTISGPERPYLKISSDKPISVMNTNFNDNWMMFFGSSLEQSFLQTSSTTKHVANPGDTVKVYSTIVFKGGSAIDSASINVKVGSGVNVISSTFTDITSSNQTAGSIASGNSETSIQFPLQQRLEPSHNYQVITTIVLQLMYNDGTPVANNTVVSVENIVSGLIDGTYQQSTSSEGIKIQSSNTSNLIFNMEAFNTDLTNSWTANIIDLNDDGFEDIFVTDKDETKPNLFYLNNKNKTFTKTTIAFLTSDLAPTVCTSWGDINNDGKRDVLVMNDTRKINKLFKNNGAFQFSSIPLGDVTSNKQPGYFHNGSFVDYDNDGYLDIFMCNYAPTKFSELYHNKGDGTFTQITNDPVVSESFASIGATWADFDNDGDQDLFIPNGFEVNNSFFINNGNGKFTKEKNSIIVNDGGNSVGSCWGDINNDGWLDLFVSNASNENNFLYINDKKGGFTKVTTGQVVTDGGHSHGCSFADVDNDMDLDLYVTNDQGKKFLYMNDGTGNFTRKTNEVVEANYGKSMGHSWFDADRDGDLDLFVPTHSGQKNYLFSNNGNSNHWISIKLTGNISNKDGIGARVKIKSGNSWQCREVNSQSGLGGQSSIRCHFGLGSNLTIDSVVVNWPSGYIQYISNLPVNTFQTIVEPAGAVVTGIAYADNNHNCVKDANEKAISNIKLNFENGSYALTNMNGVFLSRLQTGSHSIDMQPQGYWVNGCSEHPFNVTNLRDTIFLNVPIQSTKDVADVSVNIATSAMRRGFKNIVNMNVENLGAVTAYNIPLKLTLGSGMSVVNALPNYTSVSSNVYTWIIDSIQPGQNIGYTLLDYVNLTKAVGNNLSFSLSAELSSDNNQSNNSLSKEVLVVGAIDPNDMKVSPEGEGTRGFVKAGTTLTYTIRFQNVGTYMASNISIYDQLPKGLSYGEVKFLMSSHACHFNVNEIGKLTVLFENVNLPDSTTDQLGSNGFVVFSVPINADVQGGTTFENNALIEFDFEEPLMTNTVFNTITYNPEKETLIVYPNPTNSEIQLELVSSKGEFQSGNQIKKIRIYSIYGTLLETSVNEEGLKEVSLKRYEPGVYCIIATDALSRTYSCKVILNK